MQEGFSLTCQAIKVNREIKSLSERNPRITYKALNKEKPKIIIFRLSKRNISLIEIKIILYLKVNLLSVYLRNKNTYTKNENIRIIS